MKILTSADWHLKLGQKHVPVDWAKNRYKLMFDQMHEIEKTVDLHVIAGDIFDKLPSMEELELYFQFVEGCQCRTIVFSGNHEANKKNTTFFSNLKSVTSRINNYVIVIDDYYSNDIFDIIPYNKLKEFEKDGHDFSNKILFTHCRGAIEPFVKPEVPLSIFERWDIVMAGDLHSVDNSQLNIVYPGSPVSTSFHRSEIDTGVIILDSETMQWDWIKLEVPQLIRKTVKAGEPMPKTDYHHTIYEVTGDMSELGKVENTELLDKKLVKRNNECALILPPEYTIQEELVEYLRYIVELPDNTIDEILKEFNNNSKGIL